MSMVTRDYFFQQVLESAGWPVTLPSRQALATEAYGETGGPGPTAANGAKWNPIDTILPMPGATPFNSFGPNGRYHVWNYPSFSVGIAATLQTLKGWPVVASALANGATAQTICRLIDESDGVGGGYYESLLPEVLKTWPALGNVEVSGSSPTTGPPPAPLEGSTEMVAVKLAGTSGPYWIVNNVADGTLAGPEEATIFYRRLISVAELAQVNKLGRLEDLTADELALIPIVPR